MPLNMRFPFIITGFAVLILASGGIFGCGGGKPQASLNRPNSFPTATPPANLPVPILLGQSQVAGATPVAAGAAGTYTLQSGDTLFSVAAKLGVPGDQQAQWVAEVLRLNGLADATL